MFLGVGYITRIFGMDSSIGPAREMQAAA